MATYYLMIGAPAAGKSFYVEEFRRAGCVVVSPDDIRDKHRVSAQESYALAKQQIIEALRTGEDVVLDATNVKPVSRLLSIQAGKPYAKRIVGVWLDTPFDLCVRRHRERLTKGPISARYATEKLYEEVIKEYCQILEENPPQLSEGFDEIRRIASNPPVSKREPHRR